MVQRSSADPDGDVDHGDLWHRPERKHTHWPLLYLLLALLLPPLMCIGWSILFGYLMRGAMP